MNVMPLQSLHRSATESAKKIHDEVNAEQPGHQNAQLHFKQTVFYVIVDTISSEFNTRFENLGQISEKFRFILQMSEMSKKDLEESADVMQRRGMCRTT